MNGKCRGMRTVELSIYWASAPLVDNTHMCSLKKNSADSLLKQWHWEHDTTHPDCSVDEPALSYYRSLNCPLEMVPNTTEHCIALHWPRKTKPCPIQTLQKSPLPSHVHIQRPQNAILKVQMPALVTLLQSSGWLMPRCSSKRRKGQILLLHILLIYFLWGNRNVMILAAIHLSFRDDCPCIYIHTYIHTCPWKTDWAVSRELETPVVQGMMDDGRWAMGADWGGMGSW